MFTFGSALLLLLVIFFITHTFVVVPNQAAYIKERLGRYSGTMEAGFHFLIPLVDRVAYRTWLKEEVIDVPPQGCITRDNVQVEVDGILYLRVLDPKLASYGIDDYHFAAIQLAQTSMRSQIGKLDLDMTFKERDKINDSVVASVDSASDPWGIKVLRYEIKNILPPNTVLDAMEQQMKAERNKRAEILHSEGERASVINRSEGEKRQAINISEGEKTKRINEAEGNAMQIELIADATAEALKVVADAINGIGGHEAVQLRIAQQFIKQFGEVVSKTHTQVVPLSLANIKGVFEGVAKVTETMGRGEV